MYRWLDHTSEVELLVEDESPEAVYTEALVALGELLIEGRVDGEPVTHEVRVRAPDLPTLLAEWLNELVFLAETDGFIPERVIRMELVDASLEATVAGLRTPAAEPRKGHHLRPARDEGDRRGLAGARRPRRMSGVAPPAWRGSRANSPRLSGGAQTTRPRARQRAPGPRAPRRGAWRRARLPVHAGSGGSSPPAR